MIWFTADLHLDHGNILQYANRPFKNLDDMNNQLIERWNSKIEEKDTVYIIGDFAFKNEFGFAEQLKGHKFLIPGDHDKLRKEKSYSNELTVLPFLYDFHSLNILDEYENQRLFVLCHWAMRSWRKSHYASWHLFGHHHGKLEPYGLSFDVGVDTNNFYPYSLDDVAKKMATLKPIVDFRKPKSL